MKSTTRIFLTILMTCFFAGCANRPKIVSVSVLPFTPSDTAPAAPKASKGKINIIIEKTVLVRDYTPDSTNLDVFWNPANKKSPKIITQAPLMPVYKASLENAVVGAGYELSSEGKKIEITLISATSGLFNQGETHIGRDMAVGLAINTAAAFSGLGPIFTPVGGGGKPCTTIITLITMDGKSQMFPVRGCKFAFETEGTYAATMADALEQSQNALVQLLNKQH